MTPVWSIADAADARRLGLNHRGPCALASGNGLDVVRLTFACLSAGNDPLDACVAGVTLLEDDPADVSVGYGGLPNARGEVELDAAVMHGPSHRAGAVAGLREVRHAASVARDVLRHTDHALLVGDGALAFAIVRGYRRENLLTDHARAAFDTWQRERDALGREPTGLLSDEDRWMLPDTHGAGPPIPHTHGTVHCSALAPDGRQAACTTTSGLSWKMPGRAGDSPIVGAGLYVEQGIGSAGGTGRGEAALQSSAALQVVRLMAQGLPPTDACLALLTHVIDQTRDPRLLGARGLPAFNLTMYALRADGAFGSAALYEGYFFAAGTREGPRLLPSVGILPRPAREQPKPPDSLA